MKWTGSFTHCFSGTLNFMSDPNHNPYPDLNPNPEPFSYPDIVNSPCLARSGWKEKVAPLMSIAPLAVSSLEEEK